jgi:hypothetical protein
MPLNNQMTPAGWRAKEQRDMFLRLVISALINKPDSSLESVYGLAKDIVETTFKEFPDPSDNKEQQQIDYES